MRLVGRASAVALCAAAWLAAAASASAQSIAINLAPGEVLMKVEADGIHLSRPDVMGVSAGVVTTGATAREALRSNAERATRMIEAIRAAGVRPTDVRTEELSVKPQFEERASNRNDDEDGPRRIIGYVATNRVVIRLRDLARAPDIIDALFTSGANSVNGPHFFLSDPAPALREARRNAVAEALLEANTYAEAMNMRISRVVRVSERGDPDLEGGDTIIVTGSAIRRTPIEPGEVATRVSVWIDYAMVPR